MKKFTHKKIRNKINAKQKKKIKIQLLLSFFSFSLLGIKWLYSHKINLGEEKENEKKIYNDYFYDYY